jgi:hypothetical protein
MANLTDDGSKASGLRRTGWSMTTVAATAAAIAIAARGPLGAVGILSLGFTGALLAMFGLGLVRVARDQDHRIETASRLAARGLTGTATVTALEQVSYWSDENPKCRIRLNVALPDRAVYEATITGYVSADLMWRYQPGRTYPALVDPDDLTAVRFIVVPAEPAADALAAPVTGLSDAWLSDAGRWDVGSWDAGSSDVEPQDAATVADAVDPPLAGRPEP